MSNNPENLDYRDGGLKRHELIGLHDEIKLLLDTTKTLKLSRFTVNVNAKLYDEELTKRLDQSFNSKPLQQKVANAEFLPAMQFGSSNPGESNRIQSNGEQIEVEGMRVQGEEESLEFVGFKSNTNMQVEVRSGLDGKVKFKKPSRGEQVKRSGFPEKQEDTDYIVDEEIHIGGTGLMEGQLQRITSEPEDSERDFRLGPSTKIRAVKAHRALASEYVPESEQDKTKIKNSQNQAQAVSKRPQDMDSDANKQNMRLKRIEGKYEFLPYHSERTETGYNPFTNASTKSSYVDNSLEHFNPFKQGVPIEAPKEQKSNKKPGAEKQDKNPDQLKPSEKIQTKSQMPVFKNPYNFNNGEIKDSTQGKEPQKQKKQFTVQEEEEIIINNKRKEPAQADIVKEVHLVNKHDAGKKRSEKEVSSGLNAQESGFRASQQGGTLEKNQIKQVEDEKSKDTNFKKKEESGIFNNLKEWMGKKTTDEPSQKQQGSLLKMKGMETTNSDLDTILNRTDKNPDWTFAENISPFLVRRKENDSIEPQIIVEEQYQPNAKIDQNSSHKRYNSSAAGGGTERRRKLIFEIEEERVSADLRIENVLQELYGGSSKKVSPYRNSLRDSPPNVSKKFGASRTAQKSEKRVLRVVNSVKKYNGGDFEDDDDRSERNDQINFLRTPEKYQQSQKNAAWKLNSPDLVIEEDEESRQSLSVSLKMSHSVFK